MGGIPLNPESVDPVIYIENRVYWEKETLRGLTERLRSIDRCLRLLEDQMVEDGSIIRIRYWWWNWLGERVLARKNRSAERMAFFEHQLEEARLFSKSVQSDIEKLCEEGKEERL